MSNSLYLDDEDDKCLDYVKMVSNSHSWKCSICQLTEPKIFLNEKEGYYLWNRFELECRHQVHMRCYRVWCKINDCVGCCECGKKDRNSTNRFCNYCKTFGHPQQALIVLNRIV